MRMFVSNTAFTVTTQCAVFLIGNTVDFSFSPNPIGIVGGSVRLRVHVRGDSPANGFGPRNPFPLAERGEGIQLLVGNVDDSAHDCLITSSVIISVTGEYNRRV